MFGRQPFQNVTYMASHDAELVPLKNGGANASRHGPHVTAEVTLATTATHF